jgi:hypothetical protein
MGRVQQSFQKLQTLYLYLVPKFEAVLNDFCVAEKKFTTFRDQLNKFPENVKEKGLYFHCATDTNHYKRLII